MLISGCEKVDEKDIVIEDDVNSLDKVIIIDSSKNNEEDIEAVSEVIEEENIEVVKEENIEIINEEVIENGIKLTEENVYWLQESLKIAGFYTTLDGSWGPNTKLKLIEFQASIDDLENTDVYDENTKSKLEIIRESKKANNLGTDMVLINKDYFLESNYIPSNLREVNVPKFKYMELQDHVALKVEEMFADAKEAGYELYFNSGYRSYKYQESIFSRRVKKYGFEEATKIIAIPGQSEHQTGLALDVTCEAISYDLNRTFENTNEFQWLINNCYKYGFILRYRKNKEDITKYVYEPWHYRYIGDVNIAKEIMDKGLVLEEYLNK
jgi:LAS superfamily LD-carboxypeptidase LdcB